MTKKTGMLATIVLVIVILFSFVSYSRYKNSVDATVDRLATALIENDETLIKRYMPSYSNKKKISKDAQVLFQKQVKKLKKSRSLSF